MMTLENWTLVAESTGHRTNVRGALCAPLTTQFFSTFQNTIGAAWTQPETLLL